MYMPLEKLIAENAGFWNVGNANSKKWQCKSMLKPICAIDCKTLQYLNKN